MSLLFIGAFVLATLPALFLGVNNGATLLGVLLMAYSAIRLLRGAH